MECAIAVECVRAVARRILYCLALFSKCPMTGQLPAWLADWLGISMPSNTDDLQWELISQWGWAPRATLLLCVLAIVWTFTFYAREANGPGRAYRMMLATLRVLAIGLLLVM